MTFIEKQAFDKCQQQKSDKCRIVCRQVEEHRCQHDGQESASRGQYGNEQGVLPLPAFFLGEECVVDDAVEPNLQQVVDGCSGSSRPQDGVGR